MNMIFAATIMMFGNQQPPTAEQALRAAIERAPAVMSGVGDRAFDLRRVACEPFEEEPTEFSCRFQIRRTGQPWRAATAIVTYDNGWRLLDVGY